MKAFSLIFLIFACSTLTKLFVLVSSAVTMEYCCLRLAFRASDLAFFSSADKLGPLDSSCQLKNPKLGKRQLLNTGIWGKGVVIFIPFVFKKKKTANYYLFLGMCFSKRLRILRPIIVFCSKARLETHAL